MSELWDGMLVKVIVLRTPESILSVQHVHFHILSNCALDASTVWHALQLVSDISVNQSLANFTTRFFYYAPVMVSLYEGGLVGLHSCALMGSRGLMKVCLWGGIGGLACPTRLYATPACF